MLRLPVVYIRGLNTYGDEAIHLGPWSWKTMDYYWLENFRHKGVHAIAFRGWSGPSLNDHLENAEKEFLRSLQHHDRVHLVGHSMGGLVSRWLAKKYPERVASISTLSTPHRGSLIAQRILRSPQLKFKLIRRGYSRHPMVQSLWDLEPENIAQLFPHNETFPIPCFGYTFNISNAEKNHVVQWMQRVLEVDFLGDGFVDIESQAWGQVRGPYALDHIDQLGFFLHLNSKKRKLKQERFQRLVDDVVENLQSVENNPI